MSDHITGCMQNLIGDQYLLFGLHFVLRKDRIGIAAARALDLHLLGSEAKAAVLADKLRVVRFIIPS